MAELRERYDNLDGLRAISCIGIIAMHIFANSSYALGAVAKSVIGSFTHFVALFLMISGFGMCCGYYERFRNKSIDLNSFYSKRYKKILPFFLTLIIVDVIVERSFSHVIEGLMESTLVFGLLPNNEPNVIGVGWTLGVIFLFYMLFPFVVFLCWNKRRSIITFVVSIAVSIICNQYYFSDAFVISSFAPRHNILYCAPWILAGVVLYLYRDSIKLFIRKNRWAFLAFCVVVTVGRYFLPEDGRTISMLKNLVVFIPWLSYAISVESKFLSNKVMHYLSGISLEMYLAQMVIFRVIEKAKCLYLFGNGWISFLMVWAALSIGLVLFIEVWKRLFNVLNQKLSFCK